jgi:hypothetical protein
MFKLCRNLILILSLSLFLACSSRTNKSAAISGAVVGTGVGAVTGVVVGSTIANGDVLGSALLGAGIGLPTGALAAVAYKYYVIDKPIRVNNNIIQENYEAIVSRQEVMDQIREELLHESFLIQPNEQYRDYMYLGPTIGRLR